MRTFVGLLVACTAMLGAFASMAGACGDAKLTATADQKAQLVIKTEGGVVHIGQAIEASLILPKNSRLETGTMYRAGCTSFQFKVEPETGWHDPWADWYYSGIPQHASRWDNPHQSSCVVGGRMVRSVDGKIVPEPEPPPQIAFTLNDWVQFDRPGKYTISLIYRARQSQGTSEHAENWDEQSSDTFVVLPTGQIEVQILPELDDVRQRVGPELAWYRAHVAETRQVLGNSDVHRYPQWAAYSGSAAVIPLLLQLHENGASLEQKALLNLPDQKAVVEAMEEQLRSPGYSVSTQFLEVLAFNRTRLDNPGLFGSRIQHQWSEQWVAASKVRNAAFLQNMSQYTAQSLSSIPKKDENAQGDCLKTVLHILAHWPLPNKAALRQEAMRKAARLLPIMKKPPDLWEDEWQAIASPAMVPFLLRTFQSHSAFEQQHQRWLYQVAPLRAQRMMIVAMEQGDWTLARNWGRVIRPTTTLSHLVDDDVINVLTNYADEDNSDVEWTLLKFGTRAAAGSARKILASQECLGDPTLWAFLLRVEGSRAEQSLIRRYQKASARADCRTDADIYTVVDQIDSTQSRTWKPYWSPALEAIFVSQLGNPDTFLAAEDTELLGLYGSKQAEDKLWAKLEAWHRSPPPENEEEGDSVKEPKYLEEKIIGALLNGRGWTAHKQIDRLGALCVYACWELELARPVDQIQLLRVGSTAFEPPTISTTVSPLFSLYTFSERLDRFPRGTKFAITVSPYFFSARSPADVQNEYPAIWKILQEKQFKVVGPSGTFDAYGRCVREKNNTSLTQFN
jgi:hypothetical protein